jgi:ribose transport system ATP-binding protein
MQLIYGAAPLTNGRMFMNGKQIYNRHPSEAIKNSIGLIPEDRNTRCIPPTNY